MAVDPASLDHMNLSSVDLNLLVIFDALYQERQVTRAAHKVRLSQPAVSNALARLRTLFDDVLFVRVGNSMEPTKRAREIFGPLSAVLTQIDQTLKPQAFEPARSKLSVRIGTTDHIELTLLPRLLARIRTDAPNMRMTSRRVSELFELPREDLERGLIDYAIGPFSASSSPAESVNGCALYKDPLVCIMNAGNAPRSATLSLAQFMRLEHVVVCYPGEGAGVVDRALADHNVTRNKVLVVPHFASAAFAVAASNYVATVPQSLALALAVRLDLAVLTPPIPLPSMAIGLFWHARSNGEPASNWIRDQIVAATAPICTELNAPPIPAPLVEVTA